MSGLMDFLSGTGTGIAGLANNPAFNLGVGLLQGARPGGTFAGGMQAGMTNMQTAALAQQKLVAERQRLKTLQDAEDRKRKFLASNPLGTPGAAAVPPLQTAYAQSEAEMFPGETPIQGLLNETAGMPAQPASGMFASDPVKAGLLQTMLEYDPGMVSKALVAQQLAPAVKPSDFEKKWNLAGGDAKTYQEWFGPKGTSVTTNVNAGGETARIMTPEELVAYKMDPEIGGYFDNKGVPHISPVAGQPAQVANARVNQALGNIDIAKQYLYDENGKINRKMLAQDFVGLGNVWPTESRGFRQSMKRTVEIMLRMATGAAAPDQEVKNYMDMYMPDIRDTDPMIEAKIGSMESFMKDLQTQGGRGNMTLEEIKALAEQHAPGVGITGPRPGGLLDPVSSTAPAGGLLGAPTPPPGFTIPVE